MATDVYTSSKIVCIKNALYKKPRETDLAVQMISELTKAEESQARSFVEIMIASQSMIYEELQKLTKQTENYKKVSQTQLEFLLFHHKKKGWMDNFNVKEENTKTVIFYKGSKNSHDINKGFLELRNKLREFTGMKDISHELLSHAIITFFLQQELDSEAEQELLTEEGENAVMMSHLIVQTAKSLLSTSTRKKLYVTIPEIKKTSPSIGQIPTKDVEFILIHSGFALTQYDSCRNKKFYLEALQD